MYVPRTWQKTVKPEFLAKYKPVFVLLANPAYGEEIKRILVHFENQSEVFPHLVKSFLKSK
jgi:hypothetical protein